MKNKKHWLSTLLFFCLFLILNFFWGSDQHDFKRILQAVIAAVFYPILMYVLVYSQNSKKE